MNKLVDQTVFGGCEAGYLAVISKRLREPGRVIDVVKTASGERKGQVKHSLGEDSRFAVSADGKWLAVMGYLPFPDHLVTLYDVERGTKAASFTPYPKNEDSMEAIWMRFISNGQLLTVNSRGGFDLWSIPDFKRQAGIQPPLSSNLLVRVDEFALSPDDFALSSDGKTFAVFNGKGFTFYDAATATEKAKTESIVKSIRVPMRSGAALSADGRRFACYYKSFRPEITTTIRVWDTNTGQVIGEFSGEAVKAPAGCSWWGSRHLLFWKGGIRTYESGIWEADVFDIEKGEIAGRVRTAVSGKLCTVPPSDKLWGMVPKQGGDPKSATTMLVGVAVPSTLREFRPDFELTSEGLVELR